MKTTTHIEAQARYSRNKYADPIMALFGSGAWHYATANEIAEINEWPLAGVRVALNGLEITGRITRRGSLYSLK